MKTTRISNGNYKFNYKGYDVHVSKVEGYSNWFFTYEKDGEFTGAEDWHASKSDAVLAGVEWIDYLTK